MGGSFEPYNIQPADMLVHFRVMGEVCEQAQSGASGDGANQSAQPQG
jgi:hypothetical protein